MSLWNDSRARTEAMVNHRYGAVTASLCLLVADTTSLPPRDRSDVGGTSTCRTSLFQPSREAFVVCLDQRLTLVAHGEQCSISPGGVRPRKLSLTQNQNSLLETQRLEGEVKAKKPSPTQPGDQQQVTSEPPPVAGQAGCQQGQDRLAVTHPSSSHARRCALLDSVISR
ncbi:hypothetical protein J6590_023410 [Homalodisca vitripennis]|nr:hypothetical protein J6590_023410 [Homalodisca vitripennis]